MFGKQVEHPVRVGVLGGSRRRLDGIGLSYMFLSASHFKYHAGATARLVLAAWASIPARQARVRRPGRRMGRVRGRLGWVLAGLGERGLACRCWSSPGGQAGLIAAAEIYHARARCASLVIGDGNRGRLRR